MTLHSTRARQPSSDEQKSGGRSHEAPPQGGARTACRFNSPARLAAHSETALDPPPGVPAASPAAAAQLA